MNDNNDISTRIKEVRESINENPSEFARSLDIPRSTLVGYENGSTIPAYFLALIAKKYSISEDWLLSGIGDMKKTSSEHNLSTPNKFGVDRFQKQPTNAEKQPQSTITNVSDAINELMKQPNLMEKKEPYSIKILDEIEELAKLAKKSTIEHVTEQDKKLAQQQEKLDAVIIEMANIKKSMDLIIKQQTKNSQGNLPDEVKEPAVSYGVPEEDEPMVGLPLAIGLAAGLPVEAYDGDDTYSVPARFLKSGKSYCVAKIAGTSMTNAGIEDGSYVLLEHSSAGCDGCIAVVTYEGTTTLKRLHQNDDGSWELRYEDGSGAIIPLKEGQWEVSGLFVRVL